MPIHRIPRATMHEDIRSIEREGEEVVHVSPDGDFVLIVTRTLGARFETRPAS